MGGGDLNMKKSWHPLLMKNQERVWLEEKKALEEKKKLDQLRKEKEEERQLQELQRMQEEQTGRKRQEKLDWMYTTPATGSTQNPNDLEDYLLGKKRVDKILTADENEKIGAAHKNFIAIQHANTLRDTAAKIREDPLLAIKQQEQAAYQALMANPLRLREMQERNGIQSKKEKKHKKDKKRRRKAPQGQAQSRLSLALPGVRSGATSLRPQRLLLSPAFPSPHSRRSRSPPPRARFNEDRHDGYHSTRRGRSRDRSPDRYHDSRRRSPVTRVKTWPRSDDSDDNMRELRRDRSPAYQDFRKRRRSPSPRKDDPHSPPKRLNDGRATGTLTQLLERERAEHEAEERERVKSKGMGGFLSHEQKKVFGGSGGLEERIRRGRGQMRVDGD
ncbi:Pre-mRNA splicing factor-domain-containing protein [Epithele typhae]|uniref:Pre-mRNA splicing factor-domain-containing protein n=1 Tax=Epithele typhae TaxID=378194 RepID=UPI00200781C7|nr:Pre-mRNA splicing factor-domain-containing protein [Epithele typhae]KAH9944253.1 Pre-mRNA splicing factor-domain-containing protein [Epithele typhae]